MEKLPHIDTIIFDLDGTLLNLDINYEVLRKRLNKYFLKFGLDLNFKPILETIENAINYLGFKGYEIKKNRKYVFKIIEKYETEAAEKTRLFRGVKNLLVWLKKKDKKLAIASRNGNKAVIKSLKKTGVYKYFDYISGRDDVEKQKPHEMQIKKIMSKLNSRSEDTLMVGDHIYDIKSGKGANVFCVGVLTGNFDKTSFEENGADAVLESVVQIKNLLNNSIKKGHK